MHAAVLDAISAICRLQQRMMMREHDQRWHTLAHTRKDPGLARWVDRGGRLVQDDDRGTARQRDSLAFSARQCAPLDGKRAIQDIPLSLTREFVQFEQRDQFVQIFV